jgi:hypothetical protein
VTMAISTEGFIGGGAQADTTAPVLAVISPTPGALPGAAGGFPADYVNATITPVVLQVTDLDPGLDYVSVVATFTDAHGVVTAETIYRRGQFVGLYVAGSYQLVIANGIELHITRTGGWPGITNQISTMSFDIDALDQAGNLA